MNKLEENNVIANAETIAKVEAAPFMTYNPAGSMWSAPTNGEMAPTATDNHSEVEAAPTKESVMAVAPEETNSETQVAGTPRAGKRSSPTRSAGTIMPG